MGCTSDDCEYFCTVASICKIWDTCVSKLPFTPHILPLLSPPSCLALKHEKARAQHAYENNVKGQRQSHCFCYLLCRFHLIFDLSSTAVPHFGHIHYKVAAADSKPQQLHSHIAAHHAYQQLLEIMYSCISDLETGLDLL
jgi:hypothetical protein